jgi:hypothetical protein
MRLLLTLLILLITTPASAPLYDSVGRARGKLAHQYHGLSTDQNVRGGVSEIGYDGVETFTRDGRRCILYTEGCEEYIKSKLGG